MHYREEEEEEDFLHDVGFFDVAATFGEIEISD